MLLSVSALPSTLAPHLLFTAESGGSSETCYTLHCGGGVGCPKLVERAAARFDRREAYFGSGARCSQRQGGTASIGASSVFGGVGLTQAGHCCTEGSVAVPRGAVEANLDGVLTGSTRDMWVLPAKRVARRHETSRDGSAAPRRRSSCG